jgi:hypothetical protein
MPYMRRSVRGMDRKPRLAAVLLLLAAMAVGGCQNYSAACGRYSSACGQDDFPRPPGLCPRQDMAALAGPR